MELAIERRQELVAQSKMRHLTVDEAEELQAILYKELHHDYHVGENWPVSISCSPRYNQLHGLLCKNGGHG